MIGERNAPILSTPEQLEQDWGIHPDIITKLKPKGTYFPYKQPGLHLYDTREAIRLQEKLCPIETT